MRVELSLELMFNRSVCVCVYKHGDCAHAKFLQIFDWFASSIESLNVWKEHWEVQTRQLSEWPISLTNNELKSKFENAIAASQIVSSGG